MVSQQISLRLPPKLLADAKRHAVKHGYRNIQTLIEEELRNLVYDDNIVLTASGKAKLAQALQEVREGKTIPGDVVLAKMRTKAFGAK